MVVSIKGIDVVLQLDGVGAASLQTRSDSVVLRLGRVRNSHNLFCDVLR